MSLPVGSRSSQWKEAQILEKYLLPKNLGNTSSSRDHELINTIDIYSYDPWHLPLQSRIKSEDQEWFFFNLMKNRYKTGERQSRTTESGFWKKTGETTDIMRKSSGRSSSEKIGEKRVLMFYWNRNHGGAKSNWVMHEYQCVSSSPTQKMKYRLCKVVCKDEDWLPNQELQNPPPLSGFFNVQQQMELDDSIHQVNNFSSSDWEYLQQL